MSQPVTMHRFIFILLLVASVQSAVAQRSIRDYVKQQTVPIQSIQPSDTNYQELEAIGNAIGDARIVMLGEQDHGDAPAFLAKTRLVKYLHEKKGFTVLAFESDFFGLNYGWDGVSKKSPVIDSFLKDNIFPIWTYCDACTDLFYKYIPATQETGTALQVTGFDNQLILHYSFKRLVTAFDSICRALSIPLIAPIQYKGESFKLMDRIWKLYTGQIKESVYVDELLADLQRTRRELAGKLPENDFWMVLMDNLLSWTEDSRLRGKNDVEAGNARDEQMAKNLAWLANTKFRNEKIIVWAANGHIANYTYRYGSSQPWIKRMGYFFRENYGQGLSSYILGFTSYQGTAGRITMRDTYPVHAPEKNGFENWIHPSYTNAFVDFKSYQGSRTEKFKMKGLAHASSDAPWTAIYDGVFFIRDMYPCVGIK